MNEWYQNLSTGMADAVASTAPSIARVHGRKRLGATGIIWSENAIVTASHVIRTEGKVGVVLHDGSTHEATLAGRDDRSDIAVLRVDGVTLSPANLASADHPLRVGNLVLALGRPGEQVQATLGVVSAIGTRRLAGAIQTDVLMYPGFSGGPLVDAFGKVQGMNTSGFHGGVSIALSTAKINDVTTALLKHGRMKQGFLGVGAQAVRLPESLVEELDQETGLILVSVENDSPAAEAGLMIGDVLIAVDGEPTFHIDALMLALSGDRVGKTVPVKLLRGGTVTGVDVTIGERP